MVDFWVPSPAGRDGGAKKEGGGRATGVVTDQHWPEGYRAWRGHDHNRGLALKAEHSQRELVVLAKKLLRATEVQLGMKTTEGGR